MVDRWTEAEVTALAPDASSTAAGRKLAASGAWSGTGSLDDPALLWGECRGSGKAPYRTAVDLSGPAFSCTCPSRKFPCKHALALLLRWAGGTVPAATDPADWAGAWLASRAERAARAAARGAGTPAGEGPADPEAAQRRAEQRERRMLDGLAELGQWLRDRVRTGLAGSDRAGYEPFDTLAARLVDAQVPAVASAVRRLAATTVSGEGWHGRLLEEYALLHLLATAAPPALAGPDPLLAATVRAHLGVNVPKDDVLRLPGRRDRWTVLARRDTEEDRLTVRRVWLHGEADGPALVMSFSAAGQPLDASLVPGTVLDAEVHRYPGAVPLRALVGARHGTAARARQVRFPPTGVAAALDAWAAALAADPWLRSWPVVLTDVVPVVDGDGWWLVDASGSLPLRGAGEWELLAASGGHPVTVLVEVGPRGAVVVAHLPFAAVGVPAS